MPRPRYFVFDLRPLRIRYSRDLLKIFLIAVGCLSVGLHVAVFSRSNFDTTCNPGHNGHGIAEVRSPAAGNGGSHRFPATWDSSESRRSRSSSDPEAELRERRRLSGGRQKTRRYEKNGKFVAGVEEEASGATGALPDVALNDAVDRRSPPNRKNYKVLWRYYRMTGNVTSASPYARPRQSVSPYRTMRDVFIANGRYRPRIEYGCLWKLHGIL